MAQANFSAPAGTRDVFAPESTRRRALANQFADAAHSAGFGLLESPIFEHLGVFKRLGEATDVVQKELFNFQDKSDPPNDLALRPELTAGVCRAFAQHRPPTPWKVWYEGPQFRYERPQAGRYRQFSQLGAETLGTNDPTADVEMIALAARFFESLSLSQVTLSINSLGNAESRASYVAALTDYFQSSDLSEQSQETLTRNPLRVLDSKRDHDQSIIAAAPQMTDHLSSECAEHFGCVCSGLDTLHISYEVSPRLVRGLDYYTRTTFEFAATALDTAQNAIGGGGRYDGLVEALGGPSTAGIGLALGVERILLACDAEGCFEADSSNASVQVFVVDTATGGSAALAMCDLLRRHNIRAAQAFDNRSMKAQMKLADRSGAQVALLIGPDEHAADSVTVRNLRDDPNKSDPNKSSPNESGPNESSTAQQTIHTSDVVTNLLHILGPLSKSPLPFN